MSLILTKLFLLSGLKNLNKRLITECKNWLAVIRRIGENSTLHWMISPKNKTCFVWIRLSNRTDWAIRNYLEFVLGAWTLSFWWSGLHHNRFLRFSNKTIWILSVLILGTFIQIVWISNINCFFIGSKTVFYLLVDH